GKERNVLVPCAAARLLARRQPAGAAEALLGFLPFAANDSVAEEVRTALAAVALVKGEPDKALTAALADKWAVKRAAAAEALVRAGGAGQRAELRRLLRDPDLRVRLPVAQALAVASDREAVPALIDLLAELPADQGGPVEDLLQRLAGDQSPEAPRGGDAEARQAYRERWAGWWRQNGANADLS